MYLESVRMWKIYVFAELLSGNEKLVCFIIHDVFIIRYNTNIKKKKAGI